MHGGVIPTMLYIATINLSTVQYIYILKMDCFKGILNLNNIDKMVNDHSSNYTNIVKIHFQFLAIPTSTTTDAIALKFFADTIQ